MNNPKDCQEKECFMIQQKHLFDWYKYVDFSEGTEILLMPCLEKTLRVNHCPRCGAYVRDFKMKKQEA